MKWEEFTYSALNQIKPTLSFQEYQLAISEPTTNQQSSTKRDQYELLGTLRLKTRILETLEWRLGLNGYAVADMIEEISANLATQFGDLLQPVRPEEELSSEPEALGKRMLGFLYAHHYTRRSERVLTQLTKQMRLPSHISFETALKINRKPSVKIERTVGDANRVPFYYIKQDGIASVFRDDVEKMYLLNQYHSDLRKLKYVPRYHRHHAPASWTTWLLPNKFSEYWKLEDQDAIDLMDDSIQHQRDRHILQRIGEQQLRSALMVHLIHSPASGFKYADLWQALCHTIIMPDHVHDVDTRKAFLFEFVGFWQVKNHTMLPAVWKELKQHEVHLITSTKPKLPISTPVSAKHRKTMQPVNSANMLTYIDTVAEHHDQVSRGEYPSTITVTVDATLTTFLQSFHQLDEIESIYWFGKKAIPEDVMTISPFLLQARAKQTDVNVLGHFVPSNIKSEKKHKRPLRKAWRSLDQAGVTVEHTSLYATMQSFLQLNYKHQTIIIQSSDKGELSFTKHGKKHPSLTITTCTYAHPLAQALQTQQTELEKRERLRKLHEQTTTPARTKAQRLARPKRLNTKDYFRERLAMVTDVNVKNRLEEWMKYHPDTIQQNLIIVRQKYFALFFESRHIVILDSFEPRNAYFVFYDKTLKEVVSHVRHFGSKQAVLNYSSMSKRGYHDTEPIKRRVKRIFQRRV